MNMLSTRITYYMTVFKKIKIVINITLFCGFYGITYLKISKE